MSDCLQAYSVSALRHDLSDDSAIFNAVADMIDLSAQVSDVDLTLPDFANVSLGANIKADADVELEKPVFDLGAAPTASFDMPDLSGVSYRALLDVINFSHNSPLVPSIAYEDGEDGLAVPDVSVSDPPLDYPQEALITLPDAPGVEPVDAPDLQIGEKPDLQGIRRIDYQLDDIQPLDLSEFDAEYQPPDLSELDWQDEIKYEDDAELRAKLEELMRGDGEAALWVSGMVQDQLHESNIRGVDLKTKREIDAVFADAAARGLSMPSGDVEGKVERIAGAELEEAYQQANAVRDEVYEASIRAVTEAVQRSVAVERYHFQLYRRYARQNVQVYKLNLQMASQAYNSLIQVFNTMQRMVAARLDAYNQFVDAIVAQNEALGDQARLSQAEVDTYRARVDMYRTDVRTLGAAADAQRVDAKQQTLPLDEYEATLRGTLANIDIIRQNVAAYRTAVNTYSDATNWFQDALQAYESSVDASASSVSVGVANFDAYRQLWGAERDRIGAYESYVSDSTSLMDSELQRFSTAAQAQRQYLSSLNRVVDASTLAIGAHADIASAQQGYVSDYNRANIGYTAAQDSVNIADATVSMSQAAIDAEAKAEEAKLGAAKRSVDLRAAGALSQAASSIFQVSLSASGNATERVQGRSSGAIRNSVQNRRSWSKQCSERIRPTTG